MIRWHIVTPLQIRRHTNWAYLPQTSYKILTSQRMLSSLAFPGTPLKLSGNLSGSGNKAETNQQSFNIKFLLNSLHIFFYNIIRRIISLIKTIPNTDHLITGPGESPVLSFFSRNFTKTSQFSEWNNINFFWYLWYKCKAIQETTQVCLELHYQYRFFWSKLLIIICSWEGKDS